MTTGMPTSDTANAATTQTGDGQVNAHRAASRLGFPDPQIDFEGEADERGKNRPGEVSAPSSDNTKLGDNTNSAKSIDGQNPHPDTWKYDDKGNLLQASDRLKAEYDAQGNLQKYR